MVGRNTNSPSSLGEEIGLKLLRSVREMKARQFARATPIEVNEVVLARQGTGMSQSEFAAARPIGRSQGTHSNCAQAPGSRARGAGMKSGLDRRR